MSRRRGTAIAGALVALLALASCGLGPGASLGGVELTVTRDFGATPMLRHQVGIRESDTVMRVLEGNANIQTRYGGGFVQSIDGLGEAQRGGHPYDWFFFVNGIESPVGATEYSLHAGERIWWDYRDWGASEQVPAVVGSWPAPLAGGYEGKQAPVAVVCEGGGGACAVVRSALRREGVAPTAGSPAGAIRVLVGPWARLRSDPAAAQLEAGPGESGVYAEFERGGGGYELRGLDKTGQPARDLGPAAGLVAATRRYEGPPVWLVTGGTAAGVRAAAGLLNGADLRDRYAVASEDGKEMPLPLRGAR